MALTPPRLPGMTELEREKFTKTVSVPAIAVTPQQNVHFASILKHVKRFLFRVDKFHPVASGKIYLDPEVIKEWQDLPTENLTQLDIDQNSFSFENVELTYRNWKAEDLIKAIVPEGVEPATSYSKIGHILHLNLKDNLLPFKTAIAQIFLDKTPGVRTVINKAQNIDNAFRNFQIDLLLGEPEYKVNTRENGSCFEFDFSTVYWNPRLSGEHERLVQEINANDFLYDVFAGVGPFAVPAGKKRATVLANDLNPSSFEWLEHNVKKNKVNTRVTTFNKDGRDFILQDVKKDLLERIKNREKDMVEYAIHITMNLPALAVTFLDAFVGLLKDNDKGIKSSESIPTPICHCYCFVKGVEDAKVMAKALAEEHIGFELKHGETVKGVTFVRNVAPNKDMMRVDLLLTSNVLFDAHLQKRPSTSADPVPNKKQCK